MEKLPQSFVDRIKHQFPDDAMELISALDDAPKTSIHLHPLKSNHIDLSGVKVPWFDRGFILTERPSFTLDPLFHAGCYYPQESSSMFLNHVLSSIWKEKKNIVSLDLCAAPGGKSLILSSFFGNDGLVFSNEVNKTRNSILCENLQKWSAVNTLVSQTSSEKWSTAGIDFDLVLVDAPCSGEGMFRKDHESRNEWNEHAAAACGRRQTDILNDVTPIIREGGILIYSTCTFAVEENEQQCRALMESGQWESVSIGIDPSWNIRIIEENGYQAYQFLPHRIPGEGFFISVFRKKSNTSTRNKQRPVRVFRAIDRQEKEILKSWVDGDCHLTVAPDQSIYASSVDADTLNSWASGIYFTMPGIEVGRLVRNELIPAHALALSPLRNPSLHEEELNEDEALQFLRGESIQPFSHVGWVVVKYKTHPLGWVKSLSNRVNNYYPKEYRIKMR